MIASGRNVVSVVANFLALAGVRVQKTRVAPSKRRPAGRPKMSELAFAQADEMRG